MNTERTLPAALRARRFASTCLATMLTLGLSSCALNPATGGADFVLVSEGKQQDIGRTMYEEMEAQNAFYDDIELQAYVGRIGQRLVDSSDTPDDTFTFTVIDSPDINAFATPGGYIYVNRGLLSYLDNEAELAGVLGHEIAHVTARHSARQQSAGVTNKVLSTTLGVLTGSRDIMDASNMYGMELVSGYGREHELEADGVGARYMHEAGYEPDALLEVIGVLKNQEQYQRVRAKSAGKKVATYHGLYATHPRNDARLQTVIQAASELEADSPREDPAIPGEFRRQIHGMAWGASGRAQRAKERFYHNKLGFTFAQPEGWTVATSAKSIIAKGPDGGAELVLTIARKDPALNPQQVVESLSTGTLSGGETLNTAGLPDYSAVAGEQRLAAVELNGLSYRFNGRVAGGDFSTVDPSFREIIGSFRPMAKSERKQGTPRTVQYIQVPRGTTFAKLAASVRIPEAEAQLRLINGFYPSGEPRTGDWIKVIR